MIKNKSIIKTDVVVIGGGPAGMMTAGRAGARGLSVLLLEKNKTLGKKLLITGGGRCNLANNIPNTRALLAKYKNSDQFLFSAFSQFGVKDTLQFFKDRELATKEEAEGRIFPVSNKAQSVLDALVQYIKKGGVEIMTSAVVADIEADEKTKEFHIRLKDETEIIAKSCVIATGGTSHPETGSTGDGFVWLKNFGHKIIDNDFALVPIALKDAWAKKLSGVVLSEIRLSIFLNGKKEKKSGNRKGKLLFTHFGISGPTVLNMSKEVGELLPAGDVVIGLDLFPNIDHGELKKKLQNLLTTESNKKIKNALGEIVTSAIVSALLENTNIDGETASHSIRSEDRKRLVVLMKNIPLNVDGLLGTDKA
ncbi:MAG: aminoacetone oxidase family FAD-binding enzyme, partial [Patescibacteria group bacterium]